MIGDQLQKAVWNALNAAGVASGRVYDRAPANATFPYVTIGDDQTNEDGNACEDGWEVFTDVHVWSRPDSGSKVEAKNLIAAVVPVLGSVLAVAEFRVISGKLETARVFWDPDGITVHGVATFRYLIDPA
jgi:hypothetical protein